MTSGDGALEWQIGISLLTRPMIATLGGVTFGSAAIGALLVGLLLAVQGEWEAIVPVVLMMTATGFGLFLLALAIMALLFRGRVQTRFVIDANGIALHQVDRIARAASRGALALGTATASGTMVGSGMLAASQEQQALRWSGSFRAVVDRRRRTIALRNGWRTLLRLYCLPENFVAAVELVEQQMALHGTATRRSIHPPIGAYLLRTSLALSAVVPVLMAREVYDYGLLLPFLIFCFTLAAVWLIRPMAWLVMAGIVLILVLAVADAFAGRASYFGSGSFRRYEVIDGDGWALTAAAIVGLAYLAWLAITTLRGRIVPALQADWQDAGEDR